VSQVDGFQNDIDHLVQKLFSSAVISGHWADKGAIFYGRPHCLAKDVPVDQAYTGLPRRTRSLLRCDASATP
jgi:hypothetical protein